MRSRYLAALAATFALSTGSAVAATAQPDAYGGLVAGSAASYWRLGDGAGHFADYAGQNVSDYESPTLARQQPSLLGSVVGASVGFRGAETIRFPDSPSLDFTGPFTLELFVKPSSIPVAGVSQNLVSKVGAYVLQLRDTGWQFDVWSGGVRNGWATGVKPTVGQAYMLDAVYDGAGRRLYVNGQLVASSAQARRPDNSPNPLRLGSYDGAVNFLNADLDDVSVYGRALTGSDVADHWQQQGAQAPVPDPQPSPSPTPTDRYSDSFDTLDHWYCKGCLHQPSAAEHYTLVRSLTPSSVAISAPTARIARFEHTSQDLANGDFHDKAFFIADPYASAWRAGISPSEASGAYVTHVYVPSGYTVGRAWVNVLQLKHEGHHTDGSWYQDPQWWVNIANSWISGVSGPILFLNHDGNRWGYTPGFVRLPFDRWVTLELDVHAGQSIDLLIDGLLVEHATPSTYGVPVGPISTDERWIPGVGNYPGGVSGAVPSFLYQSAFEIR